MFAHGFGERVGFVEVVKRVLVGFEVGREGFGDGRRFGGFLGIEDNVLPSEVWEKRRRAGSGEETKSAGC